MKDYATKTYKRPAIDWAYMTILLIIAVIVLADNL